MKNDDFKWFYDFKPVEVVILPKNVDILPENR